MKKTLLIFFLLLMCFSSGKFPRVEAKLFEGSRFGMNDIYLLAFEGYYLPLVSDDLEIGDHVLFFNIFSSYYKYSD